MPEPLAAGFAVPDLAAWREKAAGDPNATPVTKIEDGIEVAYLFTSADALAPDPGGLPGAAPFVRGVRSGTAWDIRQEHAAARREVARTAILEDLDGGVTAIGLRLDRAAREAAPPDSDAFATGRGRDGVAISTADDLDDVLEGMLLDLAPVALDAGAAALPAAALLAAVWERRGHDPLAVEGAFGVDPLGTLAATGTLPERAEDALARAGALAAEVAAGWPHVRALRADTRAYADAGASPALELALLVSTATAYLRACDEAGLEPAAAAAQIELTLSVGTDQFLEMAKLRAARRLWARVLEASGVPEERRFSPLYARTSDRMLAAVDPWVNMLRATTASFAAVTAGADGLSVTPFDVLRGPVSPLGRRIARNTQLILAEEAHLAAVADPGGGSWYVEALTDDLARAAWAQLQDLEGRGGVLGALRDGSLAGQLAGHTAERERDLAERKRSLTGVNAFPLLGDDGLLVEPSPDLAALARVEAERLAERGDGPDLAPLQAAAPGGVLAAARDLAAAGARIDELAGALAGAPEHLRARPIALREAAPFERLRAAAEAQEEVSGERPRVFLAGVGPVARHTAVSSWAANVFAVAGIWPVPSGLQPDAAALGAALAADGATLAAVCADPAVEDDELTAVVTALRDAGASTVYLAQGDDARAATIGADEALSEGLNLLETLTTALTRLGVDPEEAR